MLLALTTSTPRFEAALLQHGEAMAVSSYEDQKAHAERMFACIDAMLAEVGGTKADLTGVICDVGPGSFTGIRVGLAAAKGIALGLQIPLWPAVSLEVMARDALALTPEAEAVLAVMDAKRGELFVAAYPRRGAASSAPRAVKRDDFAAFVQGLPGALHLCGEVDAGSTLRPVLEVIAPRARAMASFASGEAPPVDTVEPLYVRAPDAKKPAAAPDRRRAAFDDDQSR